MPSPYRCLALALVAALGVRAEAAERKSHIKLLPPSTPPADVAVRAVAPAAGPDRTSVDLAVREVTVYSDRAMVVREGQTAVAAGTQRLVLARLPATIDPRSVRVAVQGATLKRIEVRRLERGELPTNVAERLVRDFEETTDRRSALEDARRTLAQERGLLVSIAPTTAPQEAAERPPVLLDPSGWRAASAFFDARLGQVDARAEQFTQQVTALDKTLAKLREQAREMNAAVTRNPGLEVVAYVEGRAANASFELSYVAASARWYPAYDLHHVAGSSLVEVAFAGLVSQQTGEDWDAARLVLSTAVPATTTDLPKLPAWKIGDRDRFIPTPHARPEPPLGAAPQPGIQSASEMADANSRLIDALAAIAQQPPPAANANTPSASYETDRMSKKKTTIDFNDMAIDGASYAGPQGDAARSRARRGSAMAAEAPPPMAPGTRSNEFAPQVSGEVVALSGSASNPRATAESVAFGSPVGWTMPAYSSDLPAALAGGYDFTYRAARPETVRSGGEVRRVALHSARFPAKLVLKILPALQKQAYLVAEVTNDSDRPLLRGGANLYVGSDLQGQAVLETTAVGEAMKLPLGIDEAIQVERNVSVVTEETGFLSKKDVTRYEVTLELLNPHKRAMEAVVVDQIPVSGGKETEVTLVSTSPRAEVDTAEGKVEWRLPLAPSAKQVLKFVYTLTRPRGAKLRQW